MLLILPRRVPDLLEALLVRDILVSILDMGPERGNLGPSLQSCYKSNSSLRKQLVLSL